MLAVQPSMQDDLASLFSRNLTLDQIPAPISEENKIVYISQHYTHSAHVAKQQQQQQQQQQEQQEEEEARRRQLQLEQEQFHQHQHQHQQRPSSEPPQSEHQAVEGLLRQHGVDTSGLSASQLGLFRSADDAQKLRLVQLWTICPPPSPAAAAAENPTLAWTVTSVEKEEILARMRLEQQQQQQQQEQAAQEEWQLQQQLEQEQFEQQQQAAQEEWQLQQQLEQEQQQQQGSNGAGANVVMSLDGTPAAVAVPPQQQQQQQQQRQLVPLQGGDGRWPLAQHYMEPYMASGYEQLAAREYEESARRDREAREARAHAQLAAAAAHYRPATDPVYDWAARQQAMEDQYGAFQRFREDDEML